MSPEERGDRWQIARARSNIARSNAAYWDQFDRPAGGIRRAIDELDHYLASSPRPRWSDTPLVFPSEAVA